MRFAHLSDFHIIKFKPEKEPKHYNLGIFDDGTRLIKAIDTAVNCTEKPDFFVFTGDLIHEGTEQDYSYLKTIIDDHTKGIPYFMVLGNHDRHDAFYKGFLGIEQDGAYFYQKMLGDLRIIGLDTNYSGSTSSGTITQGQLSFLNDTLASNAPCGTIVLLHHPPIPTPHRLFNNALLNDLSCIRRALTGSDVFLVLSGHMHCMGTAIENNILYASSASTTFMLDPTTLINEDIPIGSAKVIGHGGLLLGSIDQRQVSLCYTEIHHFDSSI